MLHVRRKELAELSEQLRRLGKIDAMVTSLRKEEQDLVQKEHHLWAVLSKENADVVRLERTSATSILYSILGKKEARLEKEQQEAYAAKLKYDATQRQLESCRGQIESLARERTALLDCGQRYRQVYDDILELLRDDTAYAIRLCEMEQKLGKATGQLHEISEALSAGEACLVQISCIEESLDSAEGWGTWDLLGGGLISDLAKHSHLDEAQSGAEQLQNLLSRFRAELADVEINTQLEPVNVDGFLRFADYFFDGLIADWCVLSRINDSQQSVTQVKEQLTTALGRLEHLSIVREQERTALERQMDALVCGAP